LFVVNDRFARDDTGSPGCVVAVPVRDVCMKEVGGHR
jgi:hypothetical protein